MKSVIFDIQRNSFVDGPGIRTTVFLKGCNLKCAWCHNPESQDFKPQMMFYRDKCIGCGKCKEVCTSPEDCTLCGNCTVYCPVDARKVCGKDYNVEEVFKEIVKDKAFYSNSGGGVTFSGGECMLQIEFLSKILKICKKNGINTAVDTAGNVPFESFEKIIPYTDLFLYDIKLLDNEKHKKYVGVGNELILQNLKKLFDSGTEIWIRIPVISGINDNIEEMQNISSLLLQYGKPKRIELLPYHGMGESKYSAIGRELQIFKKPEAEKLERFKEIFAKNTM